MSHHACPLPLLLPQVENDPSSFALYVVHDSGHQESCKDTECPLMVRLKLGPSEDIAKIFVMETANAEEMQISAEVGYYYYYSAVNHYQV